MHTSVRLVLSISHIVGPWNRGKWGVAWFSGDAGGCAFILASQFLIDAPWIVSAGVDFLRQTLRICSFPGISMAVGPIAAKHVPMRAALCLSSIRLLDLSQAGSGVLS